MISTADTGDHPDKADLRSDGQQQDLAFQPKDDGQDPNVISDNSGGDMYDEDDDADEAQQDDYYDGSISKKDKHEESKESQGIGNFKPSFQKPKVLKTIPSISEDSLRDNALYNRNISVSRPSVIDDLLTKNDFCEGLVEKQSPSFHKMWQKRYFVLKNRMLFYYKSKADYESQKTCKGVLNFQQICVKAVYNANELKVQLALLGSKRCFALKFQNQAEFEIWQAKLNHSIDRSSGKQKELSLGDYTDDVNQLFEFWRFLRVPEALFLAQADIGDIILCLQKKKFSLSNRLQAIEEICLILKLDTDVDNFGGGQKQNESELYVLRAGTTKQQAVILQKWEDFRIYKSVKFSECWYRHLHCERNK